MRAAAHWNSRRGGTCNHDFTPQRGHRPERRGNDHVLDDRIRRAADGQFTERPLRTVSVDDPAPVQRTANGTVPSSSL